MTIRKWICFLMIFLGTPISIWIGKYVFADRMYYVISTMILFGAMLAFAIRYEMLRPRLREIMLVVVLVVIATAGRAIFFMLPHFKPVAAIVIISGAALQAETGFLIGAMTAFVSNFFYGQGPWTPWQMLAFGMLGFFSGIFFSGKRNELKHNKMVLSVFGGVVTLFIYGMIMDTATAIMVMEKPAWRMILPYYVSGFWFNVIHAVSTIIFLLALGEPMFKRLDRIKRRYGMLCRTDI